MKNIDSDSDRSLREYQDRASILYYREQLMRKTFVALCNPLSINLSDSERHYSMIGSTGGRLQFKERL